jgi:chromosomal replication initiation ATPase DnaA
VTTARAIAKQIVRDYPDTALCLVLEVVRLVALEQQAKAAKQPVPPVLQSVETPPVIIAAVCARYGFTQRELTSPKKTPRLSQARAVAMSLMRTRLRMTFGEIGDVFGRDHTTVIHACTRAQQGEVAVLAAHLDTVRA